MTSTNLTRDEARTRSAAIRANHYDIHVDLTQGDTHFPSTTTINLTALTDTSTFIDLRAAEVHSVTVDGVDVTDTAVPRTEEGAYDEKHGIALRNLTAGDHTVVVSAKAVYSRTGQGLHRYVDPADDNVYFYTQFETADAKRMFACFDQPDMKATYSLTVVTDPQWRVIGNGEQTVTTANGVATHTSTIDYPLSTYLVAICVGPYYEVRDTWTGTLTHYPETPADQPHDVTIPLGIYCRQSIAKHLDDERLFTETKQGFDFYHAHFGVAYPFGKYDQIFVPEFNMGAMENAGCVTHRDEYVFTSKTTEARYERRCDTVLHEMAHMWFGDLVTMQWWDDLWLNESFATWAATISEAEATEYTQAWVTFANTEKSWAYQQDQLPSTHPISADATDIETVEQNFDGITYAKGASVLKQLQAYVGREAFFAGVRRHFAAHAFSNATFDDLLGHLQEASGRDLSGWAGQWLQTTGINELAPNFTVGEDGTYTSFAVTQTGAQPGAGECRTHRIAVGLYRLTDAGVVERYATIDHDVDGETTDITELVGERAADLVLVNDEDLTYCLMQLDEKSAQTVIDHIGEISDPMPRTLCWSASWEMTRAGRMRARDFVALVARGAAKEVQVSVLERILQQATSAVNSYADPAWVESEGRETLVRALVDGMNSAEPSSDHQLAFVKALLGIRITDASRPVFEAIANGQAPAAGVVVDDELSWQALCGLIADGAIADPAAAIADMRVKDTSSQGQNFAWMCDAAINTEEHKRAIFDEVTAPGCSLSNLCIRHKNTGFIYDGSTDTRLPLFDAYFAAAPVMWEKQTPEMALATLDMIYPRDVISEEALAAADAFLAGDHPAGLRRVISENRDRVARSLRNRAVDAR